MSVPRGGLACASVLVKDPNDIDDFDGIRGPIDVLQYEDALNNVRTLNRDYCRRRRHRRPRGLRPGGDLHDRQPYVEEA